MTSLLRQRVLVNVQIEGTTDFSFLDALGGIYSPERVLVYQLASKKFIRLSELSSRPARALIKIGRELLGNAALFNHRGSADGPSDGHLYSRKNLPPDTAAVCGLFSPSIFSGVLENPFISIILKDPLERMITLYQEWQAVRGEVEWRVKVPYDQGLPFVKFALREVFLNYQSRCLGSRRLGDFDLVGIAECQEGFLAQLKNQDWTSFVIQSDQGIQLENPRYQKLGLTPEFLNEFKERNQLDYSIYQLAKEFMGYCR